MTKDKKKKQRMEPRKLKGFNDFFAEDMKLREYIIGIFKDVYEKYGYEPLETPALEYTELMLGQSGEEAENQFYRFEDQGGRDVMLKFEVMTSMCRAVAEHIGTLPLPYKRYQIQRTWRAENVQRGRYREFTQCDVDTVGSASMRCDGEVIQMGLEVTDQFGFSDYIVRISNRKFLEGLTQFIDIDKDNFYGFCMSLDKLKKIGKDGVFEEMTAKRKIEGSKVKKALDLIDPAKYEGLSFNETIDKFRENVGTTELGNQALNELTEIADYLDAAGIEETLYKIDTSLARGLAHYTGPVYEFEVLEGGVGSIAGGGRYDRVISDYVGRDVPATGVSFGVERVCDIIKEREMMDMDSPLDVMMILFQDDLWQETLKKANDLRKKDLNVMLYPEEDSLSDQFRYADRKKIPWVVILGPDEIKNERLQLKNMKTGDQEELSLEEAVEKIKA